MTVQRKLYFPSYRYTLNLAQLAENWLRDGLWPRRNGMMSRRDESGVRGPNEHIYML